MSKETTGPSPDQGAVTQFIADIDAAIGSLQEHWQSLDAEHVQEWLDIIEANTIAAKQALTRPPLDLAGLKDKVQYAHDLLKPLLVKREDFADSGGGLMAAVNVHNAFAQIEQVLKALASRNLITAKRTEGTPKNVEVFVHSHFETHEFLNSEFMVGGWFSVDIAKDMPEIDDQIKEIMKEKSLPFDQWYSMVFDTTENGTIFLSDLIAQPTAEDGGV